MQIFENPEFGEIRTIGTSDEPLFCLRDVCRVLGLRSSDVKVRLDKGAVSTVPLMTNGGTQQLLFVSENGLYDAILDSRKPEAKAFRKWIVGEVLPSIRKQGGYIATAPEETPEMIMAKAVKIADERIKAQAAQIDDLEYQLSEAQNTIELKQDAIESYSKQIAKQRPIVEYAQEVLKSDATYTFTQCAKMLGLRNVHLLTDWLCRHKIIFRQSGQWLPKAGFSGTSLFAMRTVPFVRKDGTVGSSTYTVVTEAGRKFLFETTRIVPVVEE